MRVTFLGTGTSHGVPMIGCRCATCLSDDPRDHRWRPSIHLGFPDGTEVLVDTAPDLRAQALEFHLTRVDAVLYTHGHADHVLGIDELRRFNHLMGAPIPCYGDRQTISEIRQMFAYVFDPKTPNAGGVPQLQLYTLVGPFTLARQEIVPVPLWHGKRLVLGYRLGAFAYLTDCSTIPDASWPLLDGVETLVIDALRDRPHPTHLSVAQALEAAARIGAARTYFTHICHDLAHAPTLARLPANVELAYDGLVLDID